MVVSNYQNMKEWENTLKLNKEPNHSVIIKMSGLLLKTRSLGFVNIGEYKKKILKSKKKIAFKFLGFLNKVVN